MTTPEDQQAFRAGVKPVLIMALVVAAMLAVIAVIVGVAAFWSLEFDFDLSDLDLSELKLIDYSHPYFSPAEGEEETYPWVSAMLLLNMPETVFVVEPGESHEAAARRLMPICRRIWLVWPKDDGEMHELLVEWLDQAAADHDAYVRDYGVSAAALRAPPADDPAEWTDATPGGRYRYLMTCLQLSLLERVLAGKWDLTELDGPNAEERAGKAYTRFLFEWK